MSWEAIFFVNVPIGIAAVAAALLRVDEFRQSRAQRVDVPGLITFSGGLFVLIFALVRGNAEGWGSSLIIGFVAGGVVLLTAFVVVELRAGDQAMFDLSLFRKPAFGGASIAAFGLGAAMFAMFLYITLYIQNTLGYTPQQTGLRFIPLTVVGFVVAPIAGRVSRTVPLRVLFGLGMALVGTGLLLMSGIDVSSDWTALLPGFILAGLGIGTVNPSLAQAAVGVVPPQRAGMASGINSTFRQVGIATGIAGLGAILQGSLTSKIPNVPAEVLATGNPSFVRSVPAHEYVAAYSASLSELFVIAATVAFVSAILAFALTRQSDFVPAVPGRRPRPAGEGAAARRVSPRKEPAAESAVSIRCAQADDEVALVRLAALDGSAPLAPPVLVAEISGELLAAASLRDRRTIADPFRRTAALRELLLLRAAQLSAANRRGRPNAARFFGVPHRLARLGGFG